MRIITMVILFSLGNFPATAAVFELGTIRQATRASPQQYVVPVAVDADGYSTFSTRIVTDSAAMKIIEKWESIERDQGVDVVITTRQPITKPQKIVVIAQYQGRQRAGKFWLQPVQPAKKKEKKARVVALTEPSQKIVIPKTTANIEPPQRHVTNTACRDQALRIGTLLTNLTRIFVTCRRTLGHWPLGEGNTAVDFLITVPHGLPAPGGLDQLFEWMRDTYGIVPGRDG